MSFQLIPGIAIGTSVKMMKAVRFHGQKDIRLEDVEVPKCGEGQVKVG